MPSKIPTTKDGYRASDASDAWDSHPSLPSRQFEKPIKITPPDEPRHVLLRYMGIFVAEFFLSFSFPHPQTPNQCPIPPTRLLSRRISNGSRLSSFSPIRAIRIWHEFPLARKCRHDYYARILKCSPR